MNGRQLNVGFLADDLSEEYQRRVFEGLNQEALRLNVSVTCLCGGSLAPPGRAALRNQLYDCIGPGFFDALIISAGTLPSSTEEPAAWEFIETLQPLPMCTLGLGLEGIPSVAVNNSAGVREAIQHLLVDVGRKRIAFLRGPAENVESEERYHVFRQAIEEHNVALNSELVVVGDLEAPSGAEAIRTLIDERHVGFDALLASSDLMALGALNSLLERGVPVPERVSVIGFDDLEPGRFASSPLSTIKQPLAELGKRALGNVVKQIYREEHAERIALPAELVVRRSSLAGPRPSRSLDVSSGTTEKYSFEAAYRNISNTLHTSMAADVTTPGLGTDWPAQLCGAFVSEVCGRRTGLLKRVTFIDSLEQLLLRVTDSRGDLNACQNMITSMRQQLGPWLQDAPAQRETAEQLWHNARTLIAGIAERYQVQLRLELAYWRRSVQELGSELLRCRDFEELGQAVLASLPQLGIPACAVCTYEPPEKCRLRVGYDLYASAEYPVSVFPQRELLPEGVFRSDRRTTWVVESLHDAERPLGYVVFEMGPEEAEVYTLLRDYLTGALRGIEWDFEAPEYIPEPPPGAIK